MADSPSNENTCVVCFKNVLYYSIGECDHPVCFECSTRMRVLCLQNECPICRQNLSKVVFTDTVTPYKELRSRPFIDKLFERQFKIGFCSEEIKRAYELLLENRCKLCEKLAPFRTFSMLNDHMRKVHERYFCDLCVKHLKIFTSERKCYTRQELAHHRRRGDLDDTSHRGHPLCEFCEERFMDADELYRHLRKEHLYCHLCDADGRNLYYASHSALAHHFRTDHYLCEEGDCAGDHLTSVFRSEIDLKAHKATVHGRGMPRGAARQARTLELQFNITPHPVVQRTPRERDREREREREREHSPPAAAVTAQAHIDTRSDAQFPRLSAAAAPHGLVLAAPARPYRGMEGLARTDKNFPALEGAGPSRAPRPIAPTAPVAATIVRNSKPSVSIQLQGQPASASNFRLTQTSAHRPAPAPRAAPAQHKQPLDDDDFPSLGLARDDHPSLGAATVQPPKVTLINSQDMQALKNNHSINQPKKAPLSVEAFPALSGESTAPDAPPQWIRVPRAKDKPRATRAPPAPAPLAPREPSFNPVADFPTLPANNAKAKSKKTPPLPPPPSTPVVDDPPKSNKKEKKKQNKQKETDVGEKIVLNGTGGDRKPGKETYASVNATETRDKKTKPAEVSDERNGNGGNGDFQLTAREYPPLGAPPGFGMTFTNSSGQTFPAPPHAYLPPPDFEPRNRELVRRLAAALGAAPAVAQFQAASRAFRESGAPADRFRRQCRAALGDHYAELFPELVALLPDIPKQQELARGADVTLALCDHCGQMLAPRDVAPHHSAHWPERPRH